MNKRKNGNFMARKLKEQEAASFTETSSEAELPLNALQESDWFQKVTVQRDTNLSLSAELQAWLNGEFRSKSGF